MKQSSDKERKLSYCGDGGNIGNADTRNRSTWTFPERELSSAEEVTNDDSPDRHKEYIPGLYEPGTMSFSYRYGKSAFASMETVFMGASVAGATPADSIKFWTYTLPDGSVAKWRGFITSHKLPAELEGVLTVEGEMQVIGKVTFSAGGGA